MAVVNYQGTNTNSASGYFRRYFGDFTDARGILFRVEILDSVVSSTGFNFANNDPTPFNIGRDGVTISWDGSTDDLHSPIIPSTATFDFLLEGTRHWAFPDVLASSVEDRFLVAVFQVTPIPGVDPRLVPVWFGTLAPEGISYVSHESNEFLRITAHDGLAALNDIPYQDDDGEPYTTDGSLAKHLQRVFEKLPTASLWRFGHGNGGTALSDSSAASVYSPPFLIENSYIGPSQVVTAIAGVPDAYSVLSNVQAKAVAFYEIETQEDKFGGTFANKTTSTCGEVLDAILQALGLRCFLSDGSFWLQHWAAISGDRSSVYVHHFNSVAHLGSRAKNVLGSALTDYDFDLDAENYAIARGLTTRYLFPIQRAVSTHKKGGSRILVSGNSVHTPLGGQDPETGVFWITHEDYTSPNVLISETGAVLGGDSPVMRCKVRGIKTGRGTGAFPEPAIGMKTILRFTIKIGDYYLKRNLTSYSLAGNSTDELNIYRATSADLNYLELVQDGAVEWTTTPSTYSLVTPFVGMGSPEPDVILQGDDDEIVRVGGYHIETRNNGTEFKFVGTTFGDGTTDGLNAAFDIDWTLPGMPDNVDEHVGVLFKCEVRYKSRMNLTIDLDDIVVPDVDQVHGRLSDFKLFATGDSGDGDVVFVADTDSNRAIVKVCETILGDRYTTGDAVGALRVWNPGTSTWLSTGSSTWRTMDAPSSGSYLHTLHASLGIQERAKLRRMISGSFVYDTSNVSTMYAPSADLLPSFRKLFSFAIGNTTRSYAGLSMTWTIKSSTFDFEGFLVDVDRDFTSTTSDGTTIPRDDTGTSTGGTTPDGGGGLPAEIYQLRSDIAAGGGTGDLSTEDAAKLNAITLDASNRIASFLVTGGTYPLDNDNLSPAFTINGSDELTALTIAAGVTNLITADNVDDSGSAHKFATAGQLTQITTNTNNVSAIDTRVTTNEGDISSLQTSVSTNSGKISTLEGTTAGHTSSISSLQTSVATNTTNISINASDIDDLEILVDRIFDLIKDTTGGGGKGVYYDSSKVVTNSYLGLANKIADLRASDKTGISIVESSPGTITISVRSGPTTNEVETQALEIVGNSVTANKAEATFDASTRVTIQGGLVTNSITFPSGGTGSANFSNAADVVGITTSHVDEGSRLYFTNARADARIAAASVMDLTDVTNAGSGIIISDAERTKLAGIASGAEVNVVETNLSTADQTISGTRKINLGTSGVLFVGSGSTNAIAAMKITGTSTIPAIEFTGSVKMDSGTMAGGSIRLEEFGGGGSSAVTIKAPTYLSADVDFVLPSSDGTSGQALVTDGSGNLSFATISGGSGGGGQGGSSFSYVLASSSTRVPMYYAARYYFGSSAYGWDTDTGYSTSQTSSSSILDDYAHMGIVAPTDISSLTLKGTLRNDTAAQDVRAFVFKGSRPNGSSSSITLTSLFNATGSASNGVDLHHNLDGSTTSASISAGDLIFVAFYRQGTTGTQYVNVSYTLLATT